MKITKTETFNDGKTTITVAQTAMNMWLVWREDNGHQALVRQFTVLQEALNDYEYRCEFLRRISA